MFSLKASKLKLYNMDNPPKNAITETTLSIFKQKFKKVKRGKEETKQGRMHITFENEC